MRYVIMFFQYTQALKTRSHKQDNLVKNWLSQINKWSATKQLPYWKKTRHINQKGFYNYIINYTVM